MRVSRSPPRFIPKASSISPCPPCLPQILTPPTPSTHTQVDYGKMQQGQVIRPPFPGRLAFLPPLFSSSPASTSSSCPSVGVIIASPSQPQQGAAPAATPCCLPASLCGLDRLPDSWVPSAPALPWKRTFAPPFVHSCCLPSTRLL